MAVPKGVRIGGRQKGTRNKATIAKEQHRAEIVEKACASGITPLEYMLEVMRTSKDVKRRDEMAAAAAPYVHPRLNAVTAQVEQNTTMTITDEATNEVRRRIARRAERNGSDRGPVRH